MHSTAQLNQAFLFNAGFSASVGFLLVVFNDWWSRQFGLVETVSITGLGVILLAFACMLVWLSTRKSIPKLLFFNVIVSDWLYVAGASLTWLMSFNKISVYGSVFLLVTAVVVALIAVWQQKMGKVLSQQSKSA